VNFYGAAVGGTVSMAAANFQYDEALKGFPGWATRLVSWQEAFR